MQDESPGINRAIEPSDPELIVLSETGRPRLITSRAREWLTEHFASKSTRTDRLPHALQKWVRSHKGRLSKKHGHTLYRKPFVVERGWKKLVVMMVIQTNTTFLILEERLTLPPLGSPQRMGLTRREGEVLAWLARGKTNKDIGQILAISPRTVSKHLEHIYQKLGVKTRTATATFASATNH